MGINKWRFFTGHILCIDIGFYIQSNHAFFYSPYISEGKLRLILCLYVDQSNSYPDLTTVSRAKILSIVVAFLSMAHFEQLYDTRCTSIDNDLCYYVKGLLSLGLSRL